MIFVTGATGFLGSHLLHDLVISGQPVRALYRDSRKLDFVKRIFQYYNANVGHSMDKIEWVQGDILDYNSVMDCMKGIDQVYHCAGVVSFQSADKMKLMDTNVMGTFHVVNACLELNIPRLCHVSSIAALGISQDGELIDESLLWNQGTSASLYSVSKFRGEMEVWRGIHEGLNAVIVNPSVIIGPGMWYGSGSGLFQQIYKGLSYYPTGTSGYVDVRDVVQAMIRLTNSELKGERYIISAENRTHREIINYLAKGIQRPLPTRRLTPFLIKLVSSLEKLRSLVTRKPLRVTLSSLQTAAASFSYSNLKIGSAMAIDFIPIKDSLAFSTRLFREEMSDGHKSQTLR